MKWMLHVLGAVLANGVGLYAASRFVPGVELTSDPKGFALAVLILSGLNFALKPVLKLILGPVIILTLGLGLIVVNALVLFILDMLSQGLMIQGTVALIIASLVIGAVNFVFHLIFK